MNKKKKWNTQTFNSNPHPCLSYFQAPSLSSTLTLQGADRRYRWVPIHPAKQLTLKALLSLDLPHFQSHFAQCQSMPSTDATDPTLRLMLPSSSLSKPRHPLIFPISALTFKLSHSQALSLSMTLIHAADWGHWAACTQGLTVPCSSPFPLHHPIFLLHLHSINPFKYTLLNPAPFKPKNPTSLKPTILNLLKIWGMPRNLCTHVYLSLCLSG